MAKRNNGRFIEIHDESIKRHHISIIIDRVTGVQYLSNKYDRGVGVTVLVDQNGKPLLYEDAK